MTLFLIFTPSIRVSVHGGGHGEAVFAASATFAVADTSTVYPRHEGRRDRPAEEAFACGCGDNCTAERVGQRSGSCEASAGLRSTTASGRCGVRLDRMLRRGQCRGYLGE